MSLRRRPPLGRRALIIAVVLSLLLPGLGHAYMGRLGRALIWFGGTVVIALVVGQGSDNTALALSMGLAIAVFAALDVFILTRAQSRSGRAL
ncbi:MAG TPA: hypothetical protein VHK00_07895 [Miltoncostaeaceae bacterium]|nr:hypothetical protein [Miltoncostaeaceae bacterium]